MKRKLLLGSALVPALVASGAMAQVVNFMDVDNAFTITPAPNFNIQENYCELYAGQGAYSDPGHNIWNGFAQGNTGFGSTDVYSGPPGSGGLWPQQYGNPGNPYAAFFSGGVWISSTGSTLFNAAGSPTTCGDSDSSGQWTPITLTVEGYPADTYILPNQIPNGTPAFLFSSAAFNSGKSPQEVFILQNVPPGTYGLYLYAADPDNNRGTSFSVNSGNAHNGISATLNAGPTGAPPQSFVEGQNFVIFENVVPDGSSNITITASPNPLDGAGNSNLPGGTDVNGFQLVVNPPPTAQGMTAAQNVFAGGTARFSFSPAFARTPTFQWQSVIGGVTNNLSNGPDITGATTTNLTIANVSAANVGLYQCVIATSGTTNTSPAAPLTILASPSTGPLQQGDPVAVVGNILQPGDALSDFNNNIDTINEAYNSVPPPFNMTDVDVEDNTLWQYVNLGSGGDTASFSGPVGIVVTPRIGNTVVTAMRLFAASSHPEDDPADFLLEGSTDGGASFTTIAGGLLHMPAQRNAAAGPINITNQVLKEIVFANTNAYGTYRLTFTNVNENALATNGMQIAELQLLGSLPAAAPGIAQQPVASEVLLAGATLSATVVPTGAGPFSYKWYYDTSTQIPNATNATLTIPDLAVANSGSYSCVISNPYGSTNSATLSLSVMAPSAYDGAVLADQPLAFWPLSESSGTIAYDIAGGHNGGYSNAPTLHVQGPSSYLPAGVALNGTDQFIPVSYTPALDFGGLITLEAWVQPAAAQLSGAQAEILAKGYDAALNSSQIELSVNESTNYQGGTYSSLFGGRGTAGGEVTLNWTHLVLTWDGTNWNLFANGQLVGASADSVGALDFGDPWAIGDGTVNGNTRFYGGNIAAVAIYNHALTPSQVAAHYNIGAFGTTNVPPIVIVPSIPVTGDENGNGLISSFILDGPPPFSYQWYYVEGGITNRIAGATNSTLALTDIQTSQGSYDYFVVVSNAYGAGASPNATLNILSGAPVILTDITPLLNYVPAGQPLTFSMTAGGTEPLHYQWSTQSGPIEGATNASYAFDALPGTNTYSVLVSNDFGSAPSSMALVVGLPNPTRVIGLNGNGANWTLNQGPGWRGFPANPSIVNNVLTLTDGAGNEACSAFFDIPQYIGGGFLASFIYTSGGNKLADGTTFCIQNSPAGTNAIGAKGGDLGFTGITNSVALELNIYASANGGAGVTFGAEGSTPQSVNPAPPYSSTAPVNLASGDPIYVQIAYDQTQITVLLVDTTTEASFNMGFLVGDLSSSLSGYSAYIGFTAGDGGENSVQTVSNFAFYSSPPALSIVHGAPGSVVVSWPVSVPAAFALQQSHTLNGPWSNVSAAPVVVGSENQVTLSPATGSVFYRLSLQ
jgi:Concanavalin A-like lectin/glucanases superfamily/Bacterial lectin